MAPQMALSAPTKRPSVTKPDVKRPDVTGTRYSVTPGEPCPACGRKVPLTGKQRLAALRERQQLKKEARAAEGVV